MNGRLTRDDIRCLTWLWRNTNGGEEMERLGRALAHIEATQAAMRAVERSGYAHGGDPSCPWCHCLFDDGEDHELDCEYRALLLEEAE